MNAMQKNTTNNNIMVSKTEQLHTATVARIIFKKKNREKIKQIKVCVAIVLQLLHQIIVKPVACMRSIQYTKIYRLYSMIFAIHLDFYELPIGFDRTNSLNTILFHHIIESKYPTLVFIRHYRLTCIIILCLIFNDSILHMCRMIVYNDCMDTDRSMANLFSFRQIMSRFSRHLTSSILF